MSGRLMGLSFSSARVPACARTRRWFGSAGVLAGCQFPRSDSNEKLYNILQPLLDKR